tara:strand:+ start:1243 stop:1449 length:207 start_codon:yes stop_codon:yes gene_type:complete
MDCSIADIRRRADEIREILESGITSITNDGTTTQYDLRELKIQLRSLEAKLPENKAKRPRASRIRLDF